jgi:hypothetical protein
MKYEVKVGKEFAGESTITVVVELGEPSKKKEEFSFKKAIVYVVIALFAGVVVSSVAYGIATGDYSMVKGLAETGTKALEAAIKLASKS